MFAKCVFDVLMNPRIVEFALHPAEGNADDVAMVESRTEPLRESARVHERGRHPPAISVAGEGQGLRRPMAGRER